MSPAEQKPDQAGLAYSSLAKTVERKTWCRQSWRIPWALRVRKAHSTDAHEFSNVVTCPLIDYWLLMVTPRALMLLTRSMLAMSWRWFHFILNTVPTHLACSIQTSTLRTNSSHYRPRLRKHFVSTEPDISTCWPHWLWPQYCTEWTSAHARGRSLTELVIRATTNFIASSRLSGSSLYIFRDAVLPPPPSLLKLAKSVMRDGRRNKCFYYNALPLLDWSACSSKHWTNCNAGTLYDSSLMKRSIQRSSRAVWFLSQQTVLLSYVCQRYIGYSWSNASMNKPIDAK